MTNAASWLPSPAMYTVNLPDADRTAALGARLGRALRRAWPSRGLVVWLSGDLGAGKTCLAQGLAAELGVVERVPSPTFVIVAEYPMATPPIQHVDLYRLDRPEEAENLGIADRIPGGELWLVEWPERAPELWPDDRIEVTLKVTGAGRSALILAKGPVSARVLQELGADGEPG